MATSVVTVRSRVRSGVTLVELLVVVAIAVVLVATAVPLMKPALQEGKLRESARQLNVFIQVARARAIESGRTTAIQFERNLAGDNAAYAVYLAQTPLPYTGDFLTAEATIGPAATPPALTNQVNFDAASASLPAIVKAGDVIRFGYQGKFFKITNVSTTSGISINVQVSATHSLPASGTTLRYQIFRRPKRSLLPPLQFTGNTVVDLQYSGIGPTSAFSTSGVELSGREFRAFGAADSAPVTIAFNSTGAVDHVSYGATTVSPTGMLHLLIGKNDQVGVPVANAPPDAANPIAVTSTVTSSTHEYSQNIADNANVWVTINPNTGAVTSAENAWKLQTLTTGNPVNFQDSFLAAREFAQAAQSMGGR